MPLHRLPLLCSCPPLPWKRLFSHSHLTNAPPAVPRAPFLPAHCSRAPSTDLPTLPPTPNRFLSRHDMASALNKRQQARNERTLQELIKSVPGNGNCADCGARNPGMQSPRRISFHAHANNGYAGWASWSVSLPHSLARHPSPDYEPDADMCCSWASSCVCDAQPCIASWARTSPKSSR